MTSYTFRLDDELKTRSFDVFKHYGLSPAQAIKLFLTQVAETRTVPLSFDYEPTATTLRSMNDIKQGNYETVNSVDELLKAVQS